MSESAPNFRRQQIVTYTINEKSLSRAIHHGTDGTDVITYRQIAAHCGDCERPDWIIEYRDPDGTGGPIRPGDSIALGRRNAL